jgi:hypothetical protein
MSITSSSTRSNGSIKLLRGKENYITWSIDIENVLLRNNNAAYIRNGSRAEKPPTRYLNEYEEQLNQYDIDLEAYDAAVTAFENSGRRGRAPIRPILPRKSDEAKWEEKELKIWEEKRANALTDVIENIHYSLRPSMQNHQATVETLLDYCKTLYGSIGQNERMRTYSNLNSIRLSSCGSLQQYITRFNNLLEEATRTGANLSYGLLLFWFIEYLDNDEYRFWKESFKAKIRELSDESLKEGNWIRQAQQELLDRNINPTGDGKSSSKRQRDHDDGIGEVNLINKTNSKRSRSTNSDRSASSKSQQGTKSGSNTPKCNTCDGNHPTENCYYTTKDPPSYWKGNPEVWRRIIEKQVKQK